MRELHKTQFRHMTSARVKALEDLLYAMKNREPG
jgi:hypothetical protein